jgi:hypothetical protein
MLKRMFLPLILLIPFLMFAVYQVGDVVPDFSWLESDGGTPVQRSLYELIDQEKVVLIFFGSSG